MALLIAVSVYLAHKQSVQDGEVLAMELAQKTARDVEHRLLHVFRLTKGNVQLIESMSSTNAQMDRRAWLDHWLATRLEANPDLLASAIFLEPNVLDGRDADYANADEGYDATGRYIKWWNRIEGKITAEPATLDDTKPENDPWYYIPKNTAKPYVTPVTEEELLSTGKKVKVVSFCLPIFVHGKFLGVAASDYSLASLTQELQQLRPFDGAGDVSLLSHNQQYIAVSDERLLGQTAEPLPAAVSAKLSAGEAVLLHDGDLGYVSRGGSPVDGSSNHQVSVFVPVQMGDGETYWTLVLTFPESILMQSANELAWVGVILSVLGLLVLALCLFFALNHVMKPLLVLEGELAKLAGGGGDLTRRLPTSKANDEIDQIATMFNRFVTTLHDLIGRAKTNTRVMGEQAKSVDSVANFLAQSSQNQMEAASSVTAAVEELSVSISHVAERMDAATKVSQEARSFTENVSHSAENSAKQVQDTLVIFQEVGGKIKSLDASSQKINAIVNTITDIAEQTNLLALNAAIEAARAGEAGRGFAVVADEVRQLATRSAKATDEISTVLGRVRCEVEDALASMDSASDQVRAGSALAGEAAEGAQGIRARMLALAEQLQDVSHTSAEQASATQEIAQNIEKMNAMSIENNRQLQSAREEILQLNRAASEVATLMEDFHTQH